LQRKYRVIKYIVFGKGQEVHKKNNNNSNVLVINHYHLPPWIGPFVLFRHRRIAIVSGASTISSSSRFVVEDVIRESGVVHSFKVVDPVLFVFESHVLYSRDLQFFSYVLLLILSVYPVTLLRKRISAASRRDMPLFVVIRVSLPYSSDGLATTL